MAVYRQFSPFAIITPKVRLDARKNTNIKIVNSDDTGNFYTDFSSNVGPPLGDKEVYVDVTGVHGL